MEFQFKNYYAYDNEVYTNTFPKNWAKNHLPGTGPRDCKMCQKGGYNAVFICYCCSCADKYNGLRGPGLMNYFHQGENLTEENKNDPRAAMNSYMKDVKLADIGDKEIWDTSRCFLEICENKALLWHYELNNKK